jgi:hypothetical protein
MSVIGILCFYDESPTWLSTAITTMAPAFDYLVAVDGGYELFPGAIDQPASSLECAHAVTEAAYAAGLPLVHYRPSEPFHGNEVEKRNLSFDLARSVSEGEDDWFFVIDADYVGRYVAADIKATLAAADDFVSAEYARFDGVDYQALADQGVIRSDFAPTRNGYTSVRGIYRALDGLHYESAHYVVAAPTSDGGKIYLWGNPGIHMPYVHETLDVTDYVKIDHRNSSRDRGRNERARAFYDVRDRFGIERLVTYTMVGLDGEPVEI